MLPLLHTLRFGRFQYVSLLAILACLFMFTEQQRSADAVAQAVDQFCIQYDPSTAPSLLAEIWEDTRACQDWIGFFDYHMNAEKIIRKHHFYFDSGQFRYDEEKINLMVSEYERYSENSPINITRLLMNYPDIPNPLQIIGSSFLHADIFHLLFNLLFFFPFAMMVEPAIHNWRRYLDALLMISIAVGVSFSTVYVMSFGHMAPWPALGFSGVVTGVMGLAAYLMPRARIITLLPIFSAPISIPLWFLSAWYIGWDMIDLVNNDPRYAGTTFLAHVTGGITGYCLGHWWFADRKAEIRDELNHAIDEQSFSLYMIHKPLSRHQRRQLEERDTLKAEKRLRDAFIDQLYHLNNSRKFEETLKHFESNADVFFRSDEEQDHLYETIRHWSFTRFRTWHALKTISRHCHHNQHKHALRVCEDYLNELPKLPLHDPLHVIPLAKLALRMNKPTIAHALTSNILDRYDATEIDSLGAAMIEAISLHEFTGDSAAALKLIRELYSRAPASRAREVLRVVAELEKRHRKALSVIPAPQ